MYDHQLRADRRSERRKGSGHIECFVLAKVGTPANMAPELLSEGKLSTASDVYAFGMLIHEVCRCKNSCAYCRNVRLSGLWIRPCEKLIVLLHHLSCPFPLRLCSGSRRDPYEEEDLDKVCFARKQVDQQQVAYSCLRWCMGLS